MPERSDLLVREMVSPADADAEQTLAHKKLLALVVDDDADTRAAISELLADSGFQVIDVEDGQKAFDYLAHEPPPDIVVLDLWMPVMDGWTLAGQVTSGNLPRVPILVITAASAQFGYPVAPRYVLRKPINPERFVRLVGELIQKRDDQAQS